MKAILVDFQIDTIDNLDLLSDVSHLTKSEIIRRATEAALVVYDIDKSELGNLLIESLQEDKRVLESYSGDVSVLRKGFSKSAALSAAFCSTSIINEGREQAEIVAIYSRSIREHLRVVVNSEKLDRSQIDAMNEDVSTFIGILRKLDRIEIDGNDKEKNNPMPTGNELVKAQNSRRKKVRR